MMKGYDEEETNEAEGGTRGVVAVGEAGAPLQFNFRGGNTTTTTGSLFQPPSKPTFSFGLTSQPNAPATCTIGKKDEVSEPSSNKAMFSFGNGSDSGSTEARGVSFPTATVAKEDFAPSTKPELSFANMEAPTKLADVALAILPASDTNIWSDPSTTTAFSFGVKVADSTAAPAPLFSFGAPASTAFKKTETPFLSSQPSFSFGTMSSISTERSTQNSKITPVAPFTFGSTASADRSAMGTSFAFGSGPPTITPATLATSFPTSIAGSMFGVGSNPSAFETMPGGFESATQPSAPAPMLATPGTTSFGMGSTSAPATGGFRTTTNFRFVSASPPPTLPTPTMGAFGMNIISMSPADALIVCTFCRLPPYSPNKALLRCSRCKLAYYHDVECQKQHYRDHKSDCHKTVLSPNPLNVSDTLLTTEEKTGDPFHTKGESPCNLNLRPIQNYIRMSGAALCWICLEGGADDRGKPIVRDCACRGEDAGFAHMSCIIKYAQKKSEQATNSDEFVTPWEKCPNCTQCFQNDLAIHLSDAFVSHAKQIYRYSGNQLEDKTKVIEALRLQIVANLRAAIHVTLTREIKNAKDKIENLINKLLALVDQAKEEHDMCGWELMPLTSYEFQEYSYICLNFEAFGYNVLGQVYTVDPSEEGRKTEIAYYSRARAIYDVFGDQVQSKLMTENINRVRAESGRDEGRKLKVFEKFYQHALESAGQNTTGTILCGYNYAVSLLNAYHSIEAERLLTKLAATSRQLYGEEHNCTRKTVELLKKCKTRLVRVPLAHLDPDETFQALQYENDGEICVVTGPIIGNEKGQMCRVASRMIHPMLRCPVMCYGLINAPHLNGRLGEVRSCKDDDGSKGVRFGVHFEEKGLKPVAVKPQNLRIAFELPIV